VSGAPPDVRQDVPRDCSWIAVARALEGLACARGARAQRAILIERQSCERRAPDLRQDVPRDWTALGDRFASFVDSDVRTSSRGDCLRAATGLVRLRSDRAELVTGELRSVVIDRESELQLGVTSYGFPRHLPYAKGNAAGGKRTLAV
jgi:hypothetical protein